MGRRTLGNGPAFPIPHWPDAPWDPDEDGDAAGMTQRAYIATHVLAAIVTHRGQSGASASDARTAINYADALLAELAKPREAR